MIIARKPLDGGAQVSIVANVEGYLERKESAVALIGMKGISQRIDIMGITKSVDEARYGSLVKKGVPRQVRVFTQGCHEAANDVRRHTLVDATEDGLEVLELEALPPDL